MQDKLSEVKTPCPRCGRPFVLSVGALQIGYEIDVVEFSCACDLTEDEWEDMCDQAVATAEPARDERHRPAAPPPASAATRRVTSGDVPMRQVPAAGLWRRLRRAFGGE